MPNRVRTERLELKVTKEEQKLIEENMKALGTKNFGAYARKMLIDGYVIKTDYTELRALTAELGKIGSNVNQIARRANETRNVYEEDIKDVLRMLHDIQSLLNNKLSKLIKQK